jgi:cytochrome d ubiquinol oxidase subunit I
LHLHREKSTLGFGRGPAIIVAVDALIYARAQMGMSLAFHIVFAAVGIALPLLMVLADVRWLRTRDREYLELAKGLAKGTSILFAVGAVSGTVLSFELGLLWPAFMGTFGAVIGLPFALEGFAFFTEAIFLGIYLYGRDKVSERMHLFAGIMVAVSGAASAFFVTLVNAFMNLPAGLRLDGAGRLMGFDARAAMWSPPWLHQVIHVLLSSYEATAFAMVGIHAFFLLGGKRRPGGEPARASFHRKALGIALGVAVVAGLLQPLSGDLSAKQLAHQQPLKLAAAEAHFHTGTHAPLEVGGLADPAAGRVIGALEIPGGLSFMAFGDPGARVVGLLDFPRETWPPVRPMHLAFDAMVGAGSALGAVALLAVGLTLRRRRLPDARWFLWLLVLSGPLGMVALEAGWLVTEWGRQPWVVRGVMRTADAVTTFPYKAAPFWIFTLTYLFLAVTVVYLLRQQIAGAAHARPDGDPADGGGAATTRPRAPHAAH